MKYGWIELSESPGQHDGLFEVRALREKPSFETARKLRLYQDSVWNTFVMVARGRRSWRCFTRLSQN